MGRQKKTDTLPADDNLDPQRLEEAGQAAQQLQQIQAGFNDERDLLNQLLGQAQMAETFSKFSKTVLVSKLAFVKENKLYQQLSGKSTQDGLGYSGTWAEFCNLLGWTPEHANEAISNLRNFGEEALESMSRMGIGYRELRQFRRLPEDQKTALIEVAKTGDKDSFLELAEDLIAKHAKEKETLTQSCETMQHELADVKGDLESSRKRVATLTTQLQGRKLEPPTPDSKAAELVAAAHEAESTACAWIDGHLKQAIAEVLAHDGEHDSNHRAVLSGFIARIEDATDALRLAFALPRIKTVEDDPFAELPEDFLEKQGVTMPTPINGGPHATN